MNLCVRLIWCCCLAASLSFPGPAGSFRFAWLTDTHVGSPTGADDLRTVVRDINSLNDLAFTVLSGDITELGKSSELELAKAILDSLRTPYYIIPGNHDTKWSESGCTKFAELWGEDRFVFSFGGYRFIGLHEGPIMRMGDGHFAPEDLRWLDSVLASIRNEDPPVILISHYPLNQEIDNWYEVVDRLKRCDTRAVLVGHGHTYRADSFEGIPGIMGRSNLRTSKDAGGYTITEVRPDSMLFSERNPHGGAPIQRHAISLKRRNYLTDTVSHPRPDFSVNSRYPGVRALWQYRAGYTVASTAAVWKNYVVVGNRSGSVDCLSLTDGRRLWTLTTGAGVFSTPDIADGKVVFGSADGFVYCVSAEQGDVLWKVGTNSPIVAAPRISDGVVYIGGGDGAFRAIQLSSGEIQWAYNGIGAFVETKPLVYEHRVIFGAWDTYLYALNQSDGTLAWRWSNGRPTLNLSPAVCWPVGAHGKVFIVAPDRVTSAIDVQKGLTVWRTATHQVREAIGISADGGRIYAKGMNDTLFAFASAPDFPQLVWATACGYRYDFAPSMPVEQDGMVFFGTKNGLVYCLDASTGSIVWQHRIGVTVVNTVAPIDAQRVVVTDLDGRVVLLESQ